MELTKIAVKVTSLRKNTDFQYSESAGTLIAGPHEGHTKKDTTVNHTVQRTVKQTVKHTVNP